MKTIQELHQELQERLDRVYGSDVKLVATGKPGEAGYRKVRARAMTWEAPPDPREIEAPGVGDSPAQDKDRSIELYTKYYKKYIKSLKKEEVTLDESSPNEEPPYILVLKRQNIRLYPGNIKIALYHNEKLNKFFSVPFTSSGSSVVQAEETTINIEEQKLISNILSLFCSLTKENQKKMFEMVNGDEESYNKIKSFAQESLNESNTTDNK
jgi:hypothetical protein